jgi:hypothetical protein
VTVLGSLEVDGAGQIQLLDDDTRSEVEVGLDDGDKLIVGLAGCTVVLNLRDC